MFLSREIELFGPLLPSLLDNAAIVICQAISQVLRHCNDMLQTVFIVRQNLNRKVAKSIDNLSKIFFKLISKPISKFLKV